MRTTLKGPRMPQDEQVVKGGGHGSQKGTKRMCAPFSSLRIAFTLLLLSTFSVKAETWEVSNPVDLIVSFSTSGSTVHGHKFGFIKIAGGCHKDVLRLSWSTYEKGIEEFKGKQAVVSLNVNGEVHELEAALRAVGSLTPLTTIFDFYSRHTGEDLFTFLATGDTISITIEGPEDMVKLLDIPTDTFSLEGFAERREFARKWCLFIQESEEI